MKYMTKEWYNTMQKTGSYILLEMDEKANQFSEEYFNQLYKLEKEKFLQQFKSSQFKSFEEYFEYQMNRVKNELPFSILEEISDIRVLALNHVSKSMYDKIKKYCDDNRQFVETTMDDYYRKFEKQFKNNKPKFAQENFHDSDIINFEKRGNDYLVKLNNEYAFTDVNTIIFKNAEIIKQDGNINGLCWLYEEIYKVDDKYEIHILLRDEELKDLIIRCSELTLIS